MSRDIGEQQAFHQGAADRRNGLTKSQSAKPYNLRGGPSDVWKACREGWDAMDTYLLMGEIDKQVSMGEAEAERASR